MNSRVGPATAGPLPAEREALDGIPTRWVPRAELLDRLRDAKVNAGLRTLFDLTAIDERTRRHRPAASRDFTVVYHLLDLETGRAQRIKVALDEGDARVPTATAIWPAAAWYERELWDMFGIVADGHPDLRRILLPESWDGHPLRKEYSARATERGPFDYTAEERALDEQTLTFTPASPESTGAEHQGELMHLNLGPQHPGTHGVLRLVLALDGERIVHASPEIGFHHRGAEKMGERQTWHSFIPYTDRIDYLGGVMNNLPYVLAVERLAGITVPDRAVVARVMLCELFRISSHLVWFGTFVQDLGAMSPVFYAFTDRERVLEAIEAICGARMHPSFFRIGGLALDLPDRWWESIDAILEQLPRSLASYDRAVMRNRIFRARTEGVGAYDVATALEWGITGPGLRAAGMDRDLRRDHAYAGYDQFEFEVPTQVRGDCYARAVVRLDEIRQSLRIIQQCRDGMPDGPTKADHPLAMPPRRDPTMRDIETLIHHFVGMAWGPVIPAGECLVAVEASKGINAYFLVSDGETRPYRVRIRTPSFAHMQLVPELVRGLTISDLIAVLGSVDYVLADIDR